MLIYNHMTKKLKEYYIYIDSHSWKAFKVEAYYEACDVSAGISPL